MYDESYEQEPPWGSAARSLKPTSDRIVRSRPSPFNTRNLANIGLPPTPIGAPSAAAIEAALAPVEGDWLFFVLADTDGSYAFSTTAAQHAQAVVVCRTRNLGC